MHDILYLITYTSFGFFLGVLISIFYHKLTKNKSLILAKATLQDYLETQNNTFDKAFLQLQNKMKDHAFESLNESTKTILEVSSGQLNNNQHLLLRIKVK